MSPSPPLPCWVFWSSLGTGDTCDHHGSVPGPLPEELQGRVLPRAVSCLGLSLLTLPASPAA